MSWDHPGFRKGKRFPEESEEAEPGCDEGTLISALSRELMAEPPELGVVATLEFVGHPAFRF